MLDCKLSSLLSCSNGASLHLIGYPCRLLSSYYNTARAARATLRCSLSQPASVELDDAASLSGPGSDSSDVFEEEQNFLMVKGLNHLKSQSVLRDIGKCQQHDLDSVLGRYQQV